MNVTQSFRLLRALGLEDTLQGLAFEPTAIVSVTWDTASLRYREPLKGLARQQFDAPYLTAHRADLHRLLRDTVPDSVIALEARCTGVASLENHAVVNFADGTQVEADLIVGADGIRSIVRERLVRCAPGRFTEQTVARHPPTRGQHRSGPRSRSASNAASMFGGLAQPAT